jgi:dihydroorotate dehydrogenase (fumarate)
MKTNIAGMSLSFPIMNAAGTCKTEADFMKLVVLEELGAIVIGSITVEKKDGNTGNTFFNHDDFSINAIGLKNEGMEYYRNHLPRWSKIAHSHGKLLIVSVAGFSPQECLQLTTMAFSSGADMVEENGGCPNVWKDGKQKPIPSFNLELTEEIFSILSKIGPTSIPPIGFKLSPLLRNWQPTKVVMKNGSPLLSAYPTMDYLDLDAIVAFAKLVNKYDCIKFITCCNTVPNCAGTGEDGNNLIDAQGGNGGLAGPILRPIAVAQMELLRLHLDKRVDLIGAGGISSGPDMDHYLIHGAKAVQVGTAFYKSEDYGVFSRILADSGQIEKVS